MTDVVGAAPERPTAPSRGGRRGSTSTATASWSTSAAGERHGLVNQGWKDSWNSIVSADGTLASPPIALCEVQGYHYAALRGRADLAEGFGDSRTARRAARATRIGCGSAFRRGPSGSREARLLRIGTGRRTSAMSTGLASNIGHLSWTGGCPWCRRAGRPAGRDAGLTGDVQRLGHPDPGLLHALVQPVSYHNGSVWPHDTAIAAHGLARYGFTEQAGKLTRALLDAAAAMGGRLPELFAGFSREEYADRSHTRRRARQSVGVGRAIARAEGRSGRRGGRTGRQGVGRPGSAPVNAAVARGQSAAGPSTCRPGGERRRVPILRPAGAAFGGGSVSLDIAVIAPPWLPVPPRGYGGSRR